MVRKSYVFTSLPLLRFVIPFMAGTIFSFQFDDWIPTPVAYAFFYFLVLMVFTTKINIIKHAWVTGLLLNLLLFTFGIIRTNLTQEEFPHIPANKEVICAARVIDIPEEKEKSYKVLLEVEEMKDTVIKRYSELYVLAYFEKSDLIRTMLPGEYILFSSYINPIKNKGNPGEFNFQRYYQVQGINHQTYIQKNNCSKLPLVRNDLKTLAGRLRLKCLNVFEKYRFFGEKLGITSALILGYKGYLDAETKGLFAETGITHVLAVSGLHVGIVYLILGFLLGPLQKKTKTRLIYFLLIIVGIWSYALITGLSTSMIRASVMFTVVLAGRLLNRYSNIYNTLLFSVFLMLSINPLLIFDIGFQFSYIAVFSIVFLQPRLQFIFDFKNLFLHRIWALVTVSIAAQLGLFPLILYYYNQFPPYFILANLIAIPLVFAILTSGIAFLALSGITFFGTILSVILKVLVGLLTTLLIWLNNLPFAVIHNLYISQIMAVLFYGILICVVLWLLMKKKRFLHASLLSVILLLTVVLYRRKHHQQLNSIVVYNFSKAGVINFVSGNKSFVVSTTEITPHEQQLINKHIISRNARPQDHSIGNSDEQTLTNLYTKQGKYIQFSDKRIVVINGAGLPGAAPTKKLRVDYIIVSNNPLIEVKDIKEHYDFSLLILDSSNSFRNCQEWSLQAKMHHIRCFSVLTNGAFIENI